MAIVYLFDDVAIVRQDVAIGVITMGSTRPRRDYKLVSARWLNRPTRLDQTGDDINHVFVARTTRISCDRLKKIVFGIGIGVTSDPLNKTARRDETLFILQNKKIYLFQDQASYDTHLQIAGVIDRSLLDPESLFKGCKIE